MSPEPIASSPVPNPSPSVNRTDDPLPGETSAQLRYRQVISRKMDELASLKAEMKNLTDEMASKPRGSETEESLRREIDALTSIKARSEQINRELEEANGQFNQSR
jgi:hypothetical protein